MSPDFFGGECNVTKNHKSRFCFYLTLFKPMRRLSLCDALGSDSTDNNAANMLQIDLVKHDINEVMSHCPWNSCTVKIARCFEKDDISIKKQHFHREFSFRWKSTIFWNQRFLWNSKNTFKYIRICNEWVRSCNKYLLPFAAQTGYIRGKICLLLDVSNIVEISA